MANMKGVASTVTKKLQKLSKMIATELIPSKKMDLYMYVDIYIYMYLHAADVSMFLLL